MKELILDIGTTTTSVYGNYIKAFLKIPTVAAVDIRKDEVVAIGNDAWSILGRTQGYFRCVYPLRRGMIDDCEVATGFLRLLLKKVGTPKIGSVRVSMCLPAVANKTTYDMVRKVLSKGGVKKVRFVKRPVAMALGVGISRTEIGGRMVMEIGGGLSEAAVVCLGEVASASSVEVGGQDIDMAICNYLRDRYELVIPVKTAEQLKIALGTDFSVQQSSFRQGDNRSNIRISARDSVWGRPRVIDIPAKELLEICQDKLSQTLQTAHKCLLETSEELLEDISLTGIWIGGGTALLKGFPELLAESTSLPVHMPVVSSEYVLAGIMRYWRMKGARKLYAHA